MLCQVARALKNLLILLSLELHNHILQRPFEEVVLLAKVEVNNVTGQLDFVWKFPFKLRCSALPIHSMAPLPLRLL